MLLIQKNFEGGEQGGQRLVVLDKGAAQLDYQSLFVHISQSFLKSLNQAGGRFKSKFDIYALHGLRGGALEQIVDGRDHHQHVALLLPGDVAVRGARYAANRGHLAGEAHQRLAFVSFEEGLIHLGGGHAARQLHIDGGQDAAHIVAKMGLEQHLLAEVMADLRLVSVIEGAVGVEAYFAEAGVDGRLATGTGNPGDGVDDGLPPLGNQTILLQRLEGAEGGGRVATGHGNQLSAGDGIGVPLGQTVGGLIQPLFAVVGKAVEAVVKALILDPEGAGKIEHRQPLGEKLGCKRGAHLVGGGQQHQIGLGQDPGHAIIVQRQQRLIEGTDPLGMQGREALVGILTAGGDIEAEQLELWMVLYQCGQFGSRVATGTDDDGVKHVEYSKSEFEIHSMTLQCMGFIHPGAPS